MAKVLVSIDEALLARIDREAKVRGLSRSAFLSGAAATELGIGPGKGQSLRLRRTLERLQQLGTRHGARGESTAAVRAMRDAR